MKRINSSATFYFVVKFYKQSNNIAAKSSFTDLRSAFPKTLLRNNLLTYLSNYPLNYVLFKTILLPPHYLCSRKRLILPYNNEKLENFNMKINYSLPFINATL